MVKHQNWLVTTGQWWKVYSAGCLLLLASVLVVILVFASDNLSGGMFALLAILFLFAFGCAVAIALVTIRCPYCGCRVLLDIARTRGTNEAIGTTLFLLQECPQCRRPP